MYDTVTHNDIITDHNILTTKYKSNNIIYQPKFIQTRNKKLLTRNNLLQGMYHSNIHTAFHYSDPNDIANVLHMELNSIIETISPTKYKQFKKNYIPYIDKNTLNQLDESQRLLSKAIETHDINNWREYRNNRKILDRLINKQGSKYLSEKFKNTNDRWRCIKDFNGDKKTHPPQCIINNGSSITSPRHISNLMCNFFITKINDIRKSFTSNNITPMQILKELLPENKNNFILPEITIKEMNELIKKLKPTHSRGHDQITYNIIKKINIEISPYLVHLVNSIIRTGIFPDILKISRISPISKPDKDPKIISSYRPINNLPSIEKIIETYILDHMLKFL